MPEELPQITQEALEASLKAQDALLKPNKRLDDAVANCEKNNIPRIAISPLQGQLLANFCRMSQAKTVLESVPGIHVTSLEFNPKHHAIAVENTKGLNVDIRLGAALDSMKELLEEGKKFDLVFIDANWDMQAQYFDLAVSLTRKGGAIYVDNAVRNLLRDNEENLPNGDWSLIDHLKGDERVDATLLPVLSTHKVKIEELVDGFVLAVVK